MALVNLNFGKQKNCWGQLNHPLFQEILLSPRKNPYPTSHSTQFVRVTTDNRGNIQTFKFHVKRVLSYTLSCIHAPAMSDLDGTLRE